MFEGSRRVRREWGLESVGNGVHIGKRKALSVTKENHLELRTDSAGVGKLGRYGITK
jgi:hypothetical protein